jgi:hypothetical protein
LRGVKPAEKAGKKRGGASMMGPSRNLQRVNEQFTVDSAQCASQRWPRLMMENLFLS